MAGTGRIAGPDPREMAKSDLVVIWGTKPVNAQGNVMDHAVRARKQRGAKIVSVDVYMPTAPWRRPTLPSWCGPGPTVRSPARSCTACFATERPTVTSSNGYTDVPGELEAHVRARSPQWAAEITGCPMPQQSKPSPRLVGERKRRTSASATVFRARATARSTCPGELHRSRVRRLAIRGRRRVSHNGAIYHWNKTLIQGLDAVDPAHPGARSVAHRRDPHRRSRGARRGARRSPRC